MLKEMKTPGFYSRGTVTFGGVLKTLAAEPEQPN